MNFRSEYRKFLPPFQLPLLAFSTTDPIFLSSMLLLTSVVGAPLPYISVGVLTVGLFIVGVLTVGILTLEHQLSEYNLSKLCYYNFCPVCHSVLLS